MKQSRTASSTLKAGISESANTGVTEASGEAADVDVEQLIRTHAYLRAEKRGFAPGGALDDWLAAEQEWFPKERTH